MPHGRFLRHASGDATLAPSGASRRLAAYLRRLARRSAYYGAELGRLRGDVWSRFDRCRPTEREIYREVATRRGSAALEKEFGFPLAGDIQARLGELLGPPAAEAQFTIEPPLSTM